MQEDEVKHINIDAAVKQDCIGLYKCFYEKKNFSDWITSLGYDSLQKLHSCNKLGFKTVDEASYAIMLAAELGNLRNNKLPSPVEFSEMNFEIDMEEADKIVRKLDIAACLELLSRKGYLKVDHYSDWSLDSASYKVTTKLVDMVTDDLPIEIKSLCYKKRELLFKAMIKALCGYAEYKKEGGDPYYSNVEPKLVENLKTYYRELFNLESKDK